MGGVAEQRRSTERPPGHRIAVDHREEEGAGRGADDRRHVEPPERPVLERGQEVGQLTGAVPVLSRTELRLRSTELGDEVERLPAVGKVGDRVAHELLVPVAGPDHRATVEHRLDLGDPTPEQRAVPPRSHPRPDTAGPARRCGCRRPRPRHRPPRRARPRPVARRTPPPRWSASASTVSETVAEVEVLAADPRRRTRRAAPPAARRGGSRAAATGSRRRHRVAHARSHDRDASSTRGWSARPSGGAVAPGCRARRARAPRAGAG